MPKVTVIIKAFNEAHRISACVEAAVLEACSVDGEVLLVDSLSGDDTVKIASEQPIRIVQFDSAADRGCGAAVQLGYQYARGEYIYVLDADMILQPGFLKAALARLESDSTVAGVAGKLQDVAIRTLADEERNRHYRSSVGEVEVSALGGGGLYRRKAIEQVGYLAHRGLAAYEEMELGMRLRTAGWRLLRMDMISVLHEGHRETNIQMLRRLWRNGRAQATGKFLRSSLGTPWFLHVVKKLRYVLVIPLGYFIILLTILLCPSHLYHIALGGLLLSILLVAFFVGRRAEGGLGRGLSTLLVWNYLWFATVVGWFGAKVDPMEKIAAHEIKTI